MEIRNSIKRYKLQKEIPKTQKIVFVCMDWSCLARPNCYAVIKQTWVVKTAQGIRRRCYISIIFYVTEENSASKKYWPDVAFDLGPDPTEKKFSIEFDSMLSLEFQNFIF